MEKGDILLLAQLMHNLKKLAERLESDFNSKDLESLRKTKLEILKTQKRIKESL